MSDADLRIAGIDEPVVWQYFETFNRGDFAATASLFAPEGTLHPPFESPIVGQEAITAFLQAEAQGMTLQPREGTSETTEAQTKFQINGKVQTRLFSVNVAWHFTLNQRPEIEYVRIKLLASPQELLKLRDQR